MSFTIIDSDYNRLVETPFTNLQDAITEMKAILANDDDLILPLMVVDDSDTTICNSDSVSI